jgi:hypothetical protein
VADGEPRIREYASLLKHLATCSICREEAERLRLMEEILQTHPRRAVDPKLTRRILSAIADEERKREGVRAAEAPLMTWDLWVPALTLLAALAILALSASEQMLALVVPLDVDLSLLRQPVSLPEMVSGLSLQGDNTLFWAVWSGFFAIASGIGLWVSLNAWSAMSSNAVTQMEGHLAGLVRRVTPRTR